MESSKLNLTVRLILILCCTWIHITHCTTRLFGESNEDDKINALCLRDSPFEDQEYWNSQYGTVADTHFDENLISCIKTLDGSTVKTSTVETLRNGPQECQVIKKDVDTYVNCTSRNLKRVPSTNFPPQTTVFNLSDNGITQLPGRAFSKYNLLRDLSIRNNHIFKIDPLAFSGLSNLESLDLYGNKLVMNPVTMKNAFSDDVFAPLKNLKELRLNRNNPQPDDRALRYPDKALAQLSNLETLFLDGFTEPVFGSGFANLTHFKYLNLNGYKDGYCKLSGLKNETFRHMTSLEHLLIRNCQLQGHKIEAATFLPLKKLHFLDFSENQDINVQFFDRLFYGLQNTSTLKHLHMEFVVNLYTLGVCLSSKYIKYFPQSVEYLGVQNNKLECIDRNVIRKISKSLKVIDISRNNFIFGTYFLDFPKLSQLTTLIIDGYLPVAHRLPKIYPFNPHTPELDTENCSLYESDEITGPTQDFILHLPPKLKNATIAYASLKNIISKLTVDENNILEDLSLVGNYFPVLEGPICGLKSIKTCRLMKNSISRISEHFFFTLSSLELLDLSSNYIGDFLKAYPKTKVFRPLTKLKVLDLSTNTIFVLGRGLFRGMNELRLIRLSHNPLMIFDPDISHMHSLQSLFLDHTSLSYLCPRTRDFIDQRLKNGSSFVVDLQQSALFCDCENFPFLKWMTTSKAFNLTSNDYRCKYPDSSYQNIYDGFSKVIGDLTRQCVFHETLFFTVASMTCLVALVIIGSLIYRYRWKLRYVYYATYLYLKPGDETTTIRNFEYDVFICYAEEDRDFVLDVLNDALESRGLKVFIHSRDFTAGEFIGSNIVRAVRTCRRIVVVLTRALAESSWCGYEIQMANMESAHRGYPVLIFLLKDDMTDSEMGVELLYNVRNNTYVPFPPESDTSEECLRTLWDKLATDIRK